MNENTFPRHMMSALSQRLRVMPAVVFTGARQTAKSTLVKMLALEKRSCFSLDDMDVFELARQNPEALVGGAAKVTLDDVQREPDLLLAIKRPRIKNAMNLLAFQNEYGADARAGLLLHTGTAIEWLTPKVLAVPWWKVI